MYPIKQSTSTPILIFAHDVNGDGVIGLVDGGFTKRISKNGGAFGAMTVTITEAENGFYSLTLSTSHTDTVGIMTVCITHGSIKQINLQWRIEARLIDDLATPTNITAATGIVLSGVTHTGAIIPTITTLTGHTPQTGDSYALANGANGFAAIAGKTGNLPSDPADESLIIAATDAIVSLINAGITLTSGERTTLAGVINTTQMTESYRAYGAAPTLAQALCEILAHNGEAAISGTTKTIKKFNGTTTAETFTLDSATAPTAITRAT
ncbi:MAG: hypothetical protein WAW75_02935 [Gallionella sp.]